MADAMAEGKAAHTNDGKIQHFQEYLAATLQTSCSRCAMQETLAYAEQVMKAACTVAEDRVQVQHEVTEFQHCLANILQASLAIAATALSVAQAKTEEATDGLGMADEAVLFSVELRDAVDTALTEARAKMAQAQRELATMKRVLEALQTFYAPRSEK